jgi:uncharacterized protein
MELAFDPADLLTTDELARPPEKHQRLWTTLTVCEVLLASAAVLLDLIIPTFILLAMALVSLAIRRKGFSSLGFRHTRNRGLVLKMLAFAAAWSLFQLCITMPVANHLSGKKTDLGDYKNLQGNFAMLIGLLVLSWTLAAVGEELAYRGYLQTRMRQLFRSSRLGIIVAVLASSILFGYAHSEQGAVGVVTITLDGLAFSAVRYRFKTLWASVLAHGFNNTIGFVAFFFVGPIHGLW